MLKIGITGGIGSGKTIISKAFKQFGIPVYSADDAAKELLSCNEALKRCVIAEFGSEIYSSSGDLNTKVLADIVFTDRDALTRLNALVHPTVKEDFVKWLEDHSDVHYILKEAAILFETGAHKHLDAVIVVHAEEDLRIKRVMERDSVTKEEVLQRMHNQMSQEEKLKLADYKVDNNESSHVLQQILAIHEDIVSKAG